MFQKAGIIHSKYRSLQQHSNTIFTCDMSRGLSNMLPVLLVLSIAYLVTGNPVTLNKDKSGFYVLHPSDETAGHYKKAAVASSSNQCAKIGAKMLQKGGSAVDGAIATLLCDGVVSLQGLGIGGGFLMTIWDSSKQKAHFLNAREYAPAVANETIFTKDNKEEAFAGGKAIAVPGEIAGYWAAHQKFGKLKWEELFEDTIKICEEGSDVSRYVANDIHKVAADIYKPEFTPIRKMVTDPSNSGRLVDFGDKIYRQQLAETLKKIRDHGVEIFYEGEIAENLVKDIQAAGGIITLNDFKNYKPQWKEPVTTTFKNKTMYSAPTPGSGAILAFMLNVLEGLIPAPDEKIMWQRIAETFKWGYARRNEIGDFNERSDYKNKHTKADCKVEPKELSSLEKQGYDFVKRDDDAWDKDCLMSVAFRKLLSKEYAAEIRDLIKDDSTSNDYKHYEITREGRIDLGTAHTSVYAEDGSAVAVTSTINHLLGSLVLSESTGIILNNEMDDYSYPGIVSGFGMEPSEFNFVRNGPSTLRPMSSMSPTIIMNENNTVRLVIGSAGGTKITTGVAQGIINNIFLDKDIKTTLNHPRIHHNLWPMAVQTECGFDTEVIEYLKSIGHDIEDWLIMSNTLAAVAVNGPDDISASGDYRREGGTGGY